MLHDIVDRVQQAHQFVADWAFTYFPGVSPYLIASHLYWGSILFYVFGMAELVMNANGSVFVAGFFICWVSAFASGWARLEHRRHIAWLNGKTPSAPANGGFAARLVNLLFALLFLLGAIIDPQLFFVLAGISLWMVVSGNYFSCCATPSARTPQTREVPALG